MKYIIAIIQPHKLADVIQELDREQITLVTVSKVMGKGRQKGVTEVYRGVTEIGGLLKKTKLEIAVREQNVQRTIDAIVRGAREGEIGDGKIFVLDLPQCIRIRTGETGEAAIG